MMNLAAISHSFSTNIFYFIHYRRWNNMVTHVKTFNCSLEPVLISASVLGHRKTLMHLTPPKDSWSDSPDRPLAFALTQDALYNPRISWPFC